MISVVDKVESIGFWLEVSWPMDWDEGSFQFLVNGRPTLVKKAVAVLGVDFTSRIFLFMSESQIPSQLMLSFPQIRRKPKAL